MNRIDSRNNPNTDAIEIQTLKTMLFCTYQTYVILRDKTDTEVISHQEEKHKSNAKALRQKEPLGGNRR